ncbi:MAG: hypothetical protein AABY40_00925 [Nanoarchaeota archaeon]
MSLDEKINIHYEYSNDIGRKEVESAMDDFLSLYRFEFFGQKALQVSAEPSSSKLLLRISPQYGEAALSLQEDLLRQQRTPGILCSGAMNGKIFFYSEKIIYLVELTAKS